MGQIRGKKKVSGSLNCIVPADGIDETGSIHEMSYRKRTAINPLNGCVP